MKVKAQAIIRTSDIRRAIGKPECNYGEEFELPDGIAEEYLKAGLVKRIKSAPSVEFAVTGGAPETAVSHRGRARRPQPPSGE